MHAGMFRMTTASLCKVILCKGKYYLFLDLFTSSIGGICVVEVDADVYRIHYDDICELNGGGVIIKLQETIKLQPGQVWPGCSIYMRKVGDAVRGPGWYEVIKIVRGN